MCVYCTQPTVIIVLRCVLVSRFVVVCDSECRRTFTLLRSKHNCSYDRQNETTVANRHEISEITDGIFTPTKSWPNVVSSCCKPFSFYNRKTCTTRTEIATISVSNKTGEALIECTQIRNHSSSSNLFTRDTHIRLNVIEESNDKGKRHDVISFEISFQNNKLFINVFWRFSTLEKKRFLKLTVRFRSQSI